MYIRNTRCTTRGHVGRTSHSSWPKRSNAWECMNLARPPSRVAKPPWLRFGTPKNPKTPVRRATGHHGTSRRALSKQRPAFPLRPGRKYTTFDAPGCLPPSTPSTPLLRIDPSTNPSDVRLGSQVSFGRGPFSSDPQTADPRLETDLSAREHDPMIWLCCVPLLIRKETCSAKMRKTRKTAEECQRLRPVVLKGSSCPCCEEVGRCFRSSVIREKHQVRAAKSCML